MTTIELLSILKVETFPWHKTLFFHNGHGVLVRKLNSSSSITVQLLEKNFKGDYTALTGGSTFEKVSNSVHYMKEVMNREPESN